MEFAKKIQVDKATVSTWESHDSFPKGDILERIHRQFGVNINWLLTGEGEAYINKDTREGEPDTAQKGSIRFSAGDAVCDQDGLYGRTRHHEIEGKKQSVTLFEPKGADDPFAEAVSGLRRIFDSRDPVLIPAIQANIRAFQISARRERQISEQQTEIQQLKDVCEELKQRIKTLEEQLQGLTKREASKAASAT